MCVVFKKNTTTVWKYIYIYLDDGRNNTIVFSQKEQKKFYIYNGGGGGLGVQKEKRKKGGMCFVFGKRFSLEKKRWTIQKKIEISLFFYGSHSIIVCVFSIYIYDSTHVVFSWFKSTYIYRKRFIQTQLLSKVFYIIFFMTL